MPQPTYSGALTILRTLKAFGHEALLAGGCVRDRLRGVEPKDFDIATSARPEQVQAAFAVTEPVGAAFGVVLVILDGAAYEVATFRHDGPYLDGRRPESVTFASPEEDALRRDFTVNGLFYDPDTDAVMDFVDGQKMSPDLPMVSHQAPEGTLIAIKSVTYGVKNVKGKNVTDTTTLVITPAQPFAFHTSYALYGKPGILATEGDLGTVSGFTLKFNTVGPLSFVEGKYLKDSNQLSIQFNNPIDKKSLKESITIAPSIEKAKEFDWSINEWAGSNLVYGYPILKASTTYTVTVGKGMKDIYGQVLGSPYTFSFTTPQITPRVFINSKGEFGIFEKSKSPIYYLNSINVSELNLEFAKVPLDAFLASRLKKNADYNAFTDISGFDAHQTWTLKPKAKKNEWNVIPFDVKKEVSADLAPGIYALHVRAPEYKKSWPTIRSHAPRMNK
jgi:hypothetical protein